MPMSVSQKNEKSVGDLAAKKALLVDYGAARKEDDQCSWLEDDEFFRRHEDVERLLSEQSW